MVEGRENEDLKLTYLLHWPAFFCGKLASQAHKNGLLEVGAGIKREGGGKRVERVNLCDLLNIEDREEGD